MFNWSLYSLIGSVGLGGVWIGTEKRLISKGSIGALYNYPGPHHGCGEGKEDYGILNYLLEVAVGIPWPTLLLKYGTG